MVPTLANVVQHRELLSTRILIETPTLIVVRQGRKMLRTSLKDVVVPQGMTVAVAGGQSFDVINTPSEATKIYEAEWLACSPSLVERFSLSDPAGRPIDTLHVLDKSGSVFCQAFDHAKQGVVDVENIPAKVAEARMIEMLTWLDQHGGYFPPTMPCTSQRVRHEVSQDLASNWTAAAVARRLGMGESTLRRKLSEEGASFNALLTEARMSHALTLLQVTDLPVTQIAFETGYQSPSRFSARFRERFGYRPSAVRTPAPLTN